jgi:hypothetical protein
VRLLVCSRLLALSLAVALRALPDPSFSSLTVVLDYEQPHSTSSFEAMKTELNAIMKGIGFQIDVKEKSSLAPKSQFAGLVMFRMTGHCDATPIPLEALSDERGPLAMAYSANGEILPFGEVRCDRVRRSLQRSLGRGIPSQSNRLAYGSALAKVMAHEIFHMLAREPRHTKAGLTKDALSSRELLDHNLSLPESARQAIRRNLQPAK